MYQLIVLAKMKGKTNSDQTTLLLTSDDMMLTVLFSFRKNEAAV